MIYEAEVIGVNDKNKDFVWLKFGDKILNCYDNSIYHGPAGTKAAKEYRAGTNLKVDLICDIMMDVNIIDKPIKLMDNGDHNANPVGKITGKILEIFPVKGETEPSITRVESEIVIDIIGVQGIWGPHPPVPKPGDWIEVEGIAYNVEIVEGDEKDYIPWYIKKKNRYRLTPHGVEEIDSNGNWKIIT